MLWDLAGQHVYRQIHSIFLENVAAALVLFDPSNRQEPLKGVQFNQSEARLIERHSRALAQVLQNIVIAPLW